MSTETERFFKEQRVCHAEWVAWQDVMKECRRLGIEPNERKNNRLIKAITAWGERVAALRRDQTPDVVERALISYLDEYEIAKANDPKANDR